MKVLWQRKWSVFLGSLFGLALGFLYHINSSPVFESTGQLIVTKNAAPLANKNANPGALVEDVVATNMAIMHSQFIIDLAIKKAKLNELKTFENKDPLSTIMTHLKIAREMKLAPGIDTNIIVTSYRGPFPEDCKEILKGIYDAFKEFLEGRDNTATILRPPGLGVKIGPVAFQNLTSGMMLGLLMGVSLAYFAQLSPLRGSSPAVRN